MNAFLFEIGVNIDPSRVSASCPDRTTIDAILDEEGIHILDVIRSRLSGKRIFLAAMVPTKESTM